MPTDKFNVLIDSSCEDIIQYHNSILKALEEDYTNVILYLQDNESFLVNVVIEDNSLLINKIKQENNIDSLDSIHSIKMDSRNYRKNSSFN